MDFSKLSKTEKYLIDQLQIGTQYESITNPFSNQTISLPPSAVALYDYIQGCQLLGNGKELTLAKTLFAKLFPKEYSILID